MATQKKALQPRLVEPEQTQVFFYNRKTAAVALGITIRKLDYLVTRRLLSGRRLDGRVLIPASDVRKLADRIMNGDSLAS